MKETSKSSEGEHGVRSSKTGKRPKKERRLRAGLITWDSAFLRWLGEGIGSSAGEGAEGRRA